MPRPKKCRRICSLPRIGRFGPLEEGAKGEVGMTVDEYEAVRLIDLLGCTQEECASQLQVARTTVQMIYDSARRKMADMLVNGKVLTIAGGQYQLCAQAEGCCAKDCRQRRCRGRACAGGQSGEGCQCAAGACPREEGAKTSNL